MGLYKKNTCRDTLRDGASDKIQSLFVHVLVHLIVERDIFLSPAFLRVFVAFWKYRIFGAHRFDTTLCDFYCGIGLTSLPAVF